MVSFTGFRAVIFVTAFAALAGCANVPVDLGRDDVSALAEARGLPAPVIDTAARAQLDTLLAEPLSPHAAVHVALLQNPDVRSLYAELGFAAADIYEAGRLSNPRFSAGALDSSEGGTSLSFGLAQSFTDLLMLPARNRLAEAEFERIKRVVASRLFNLGTDVEAAYYTLAGAKQVAAMRMAIAETATAAAELSERFHAAGNINRLELALEQAAASEARLALRAAENDVVAARAELEQFLGLPIGTRWSVVNGLPAPLDTEDKRDELVALAFASRLDLHAAGQDVERLADSLGVTRRYRWLGDIEIGIEHEREPGGERLSGPSLSLELPIFNQHADDLTRAEMRLVAAQAELHALHLDVGREVHRAYANLLSARERIDEHQRVLIPLREEIVARTQEQVNYMLVGAFELLRAKAQAYAAYESYLDAVRDYWLARVALKRAVGTSLPSASTASGKRVDAQQLKPPMPPSTHDHSEHETAGEKSEATSAHDAHKTHESNAPSRNPHDHHGSTT